MLCAKPSWSPCTTTKGPDIVLVGDGGVIIASGFGSYADSGDNATIEVTLTEDLFYHVPEDVDDIRYE